MESPAELLHHHKKTLHSKRSFGKYPHPIDSPTYDAQVSFLLRVPSSSSLSSSEEDNDPLTDDGRVLPVSPRATRVPHAYRLSSRARHQLASSMLSDDGTDSQTYDGDVESSITAGAAQHQTSKGFLYPNLRHTSSNSTLTSQIEDNAPSLSTSCHPTPPPTAQQTLVLEPSTYNPVTTCDTSLLTPEDIRAFVQKAIDGEPGRPYRTNPPPTDRPVRIYADGEAARDPALY
jgi:choline-phosphate cytidylyltransferase